MRSGALFSFLMMVTSSLAWGFPLPHPEMQPPPLHNSSQYNYEGIVALGGCSGSLVRFETSLDSDRAMVLTNGHCIEFGFPSPGEALSGVASRESFTLLNPSGGRAGTVNADLLMYATMTGTDMALYRLRETFAEIQQRFSIRPLVMASQKSSIGEEIEVVSGYWRTGFRCSIEHFVYQLKEAEFVMNDSIRYSRPGCEVYGGTSGSPILSKTTRQVVGVNNTGNESGWSCSMNNPCEIDENGNVYAEQGLSYGQQTYWVYSCLNGNREIDLNQAGCRLTQ